MRVAYACGLCVAYLVPSAYFATWYRILFLDIVTDVLGVDEWGINRLLIS